MVKVGGVFCFSYFVAQLLLIHVVKIFSTNEKCTNVTLVFISCCALVITREVAQSLFFVSGSLVPSVFFCYPPFAFLCCSLYGTVSPLFLSVAFRFRLLGSQISSGFGFLHPSHLLNPNYLASR